MEDEKNGIKIGQLAKKSIKVLAVPIIIIIIIIIMLIGSIYYVFKKDLKELVESQVEYNKTLKMTSDGIQSTNEIEEDDEETSSIIQLATPMEEYTRYNRIASIDESSIQRIVAMYKIADNSTSDTQVDNPQSATEKAKKIASKITCLETYVKDTLGGLTKEEKIAYLMNAEIVTKFPYLESIKDEKSKLNGTIKFYRHESNEVEGDEGTQLEYIEPDIFEEYKNSSNKDIYKYFTIDEDQNVVIAYGRSETRTVTTDDSEVTVDVVNENSSFDVSYGGSGGSYSATKYTINTKLIDYQPLVEQYVLPFSLLATMLVQTKDYNLVKEIADLAYNSEIRIGIYVNETETDKVDTYTYNKKIKYTENTKLLFDNIGGSNPEIDITSGAYANVRKECYGFISNINSDVPTATHSHNSNDPLGIYNMAHGTVYSAFISSINGDGIISSLTENESDAQTFTATYTDHIISNSITVGVELADIWAGIWEATYKKEEKIHGSNSNSGDPYNEQYISVSRDKFSSELLNSGTMGDKLTEHSEELKKAAIDEIVRQTKFETAISEMTVQDIINCANNCTQCSAQLDQTFPEPNVSWHSNHVHYVGDEALLKAVQDATNSSTLAHIKRHVQQNLQSYANSKNEQKRQNFISHLENTIKYDQWPTAYKANISIYSETSSNTEITTYKKDSIEKPEDAGKEFKKILSKDKYEEDREALITRSEWFWEAIQENEDTEKLENLLRYLFNIAFDTDAFGTFKEEDIENIFKAFEPKDLKTSGKIYGNTIQEKVWFSLIREGYSEFAVAGVMGCIYSESRFDPAVIERGTGIGFGLCQWSYGRREKLEEYAASKNVDPSDVPTQIEFLITELTIDGSGPASGYATCGFLSNKGYTRDSWINATTPEEAAIAFCWSFERPWDKANVTERQTMALQYYEEFQGKSLTANDVVEFALQWEGHQAKQIQPIDGYLDDGLFGYRTSDGVQFELQQWCADFVSFCFDQCGKLYSIGGTFQAPRIRIEELRNGTITGIFIEGGEMPEPGDIFLTRAHTGIVVEVQGDTLVTIEGNCGGSGSGDEHSASSYVKKYSFRTIYDSDIIGYQRPMQ